MPRTYFVDTWYFVATIDRFDEHHRQGRRLAESTRGSAFVTHDAVLSEVLAYFSAHGAVLRARAVEAARRAVREHTVVAADRSLFLRAVDRYASRPDKEYSLVDCLSMILMEDHGITQILTNDHHFRQEGFTVVNE